MIEPQQIIQEPKAVKAETHSAIVISNQSVESYYQLLHRRYAIALLLFTSFTSFAYLYIVAQYQNLYFVQCSQCRSVFFASFHFYFFFTFLLMYVHFRNLRADVYGPSASVMFIGSLKYIYGIMGTQVAFAGCFYAQEWLYCSENMTNLLMWLLAYQIIQFMGQFTIMLVYYFRVYSEISIINKNKEEKLKKRSIELFNASFALNDTKSEANYRAHVNQNDFMVNIDMSQSHTNSSQFTTSCCDNTKMVSVFSADSILNITKIQGLKRSPRMKRYMPNRDIKKGLMN